MTTRPLLPAALFGTPTPPGPLPTASATTPGAPAAVPTASAPVPTAPDLQSVEVVPAVLPPDRQVDLGPVGFRAVSANGIRFRLAEAGTGPLLLLLHGFGGLWLNWRHQLAALAAAGFHAVAPDLRGAGETDKPPRGYDAFTMAADVAGLVRALGEREAMLVGQGFGGVLAFNTAVLYPDQVTALVAISAPHPGPMAKLRRPLRSDPYGRLLAFAGLPLADRRLAAGSGAMLERLVRSHAGPAWAASADFAETTAAMRAAIVAPGAARGAVEPLRWVYRSPWRTDGHRHREALQSALTAPVLHLSGEGDRFTPLPSLRGTEDLCAGPYVRRVVPGVGHYPAEEAAGPVNAAIVDFAGRYAATG